MHLFIRVDSPLLRMMVYRTLLFVAFVVRVYLDLYMNFLGDGRSCKMSSVKSFFRHGQPVYLSVMVVMT